MVLNHFTNRYTREQIYVRDEIFRCLTREATQEMNMTLLAPIYEEEIREAVFQLGWSKAPGPYGYPGFFFQDN